MLLVLASRDNYSTWSIGDARRLQLSEGVYETPATHRHVWTAKFGTINTTMIIQCDNAFPDHSIAAVRELAAKGPDRWYVNWVVDDEIIDRRFRIKPADPFVPDIEKLVSKYFNSWKNWWAAYQIQKRPHNVHVDEYGLDFWPDIQCWTFIIAFDTIPEFRTVVWKEIFRDGKSWSEWIAQWAESERPRLDRRISDEQDLEHTYDENNQDYPCDYLELDGIWSYHKGHAVLFDGHQLHCTSNWKKYPQFQQRELLQIHVLSNDIRDLSNSQET